MKAGDAAGAVDVTQVIAGIDWVVKHADYVPTASNPKGFNIKVLNLSLGFNAPLYNNSRGRRGPATRSIRRGTPASWWSPRRGNYGTAKSRAGTDLAKMGLVSPAFNGDVIAVGSYDTTTAPCRTSPSRRASPTVACPTSPRRVRTSRGFVPPETWADDADDCRVPDPGNGAANGFNPPSVPTDVSSVPRGRRRLPWSYPARLHCCSRGR